MLELGTLKSSASVTSVLTSFTIPSQQKLPPLEPDEDEILGTTVYEGRLAAERLADSEISLEVDEYFELEHKVEQGQAARQALDSPIILGKDPSDYVTVADTLDDPTALTDMYAIETQIALKQVWDTAKELHRRQIFSDDEWKLFTARYEDGLTQQEIADLLGIVYTQSAASLRKGYRPYYSCVGRDDRRAKSRNRYNCP